MDLQWYGSMPNWQRARDSMERLTTNKSVTDMTMLELMHNNCYVDNDRNARYRDYNLDVDSRWLVRNLAKDICGEDFKDLSDEEVDEYMDSMLSVGIDSTIGLLALFYRNLWAMADLREKLATYEDAEEQGLLLRLPCKVGDIVWEINAERKRISKFVIESITIYPCNVIQFNWTLLEGICKNVVGFSKTELGITVFLTREEAEAKLKEMEGESDVL